MNAVVVLFASVFWLSLYVYTRAMVTNQPSQTPSTAEWRQLVHEVNSTAVLAHVLKEYLDDIETVELAVPSCATGHRERHQEAGAALKAALDYCEGQRRGDLAQCVEEQTRRTVSDVRQSINSLKNCVDS